MWANQPPWSAGWPTPYPPQMGQTGQVDWAALAKQWIMQREMQEQQIAEHQAQMEAHNAQLEAQQKALELLNEQQRMMMIQNEQLTAPPPPPPPPEHFDDGAEMELCGEDEEMSASQHHSPEQLSTSNGGNLGIWGTVWNAAHNAGPNWKPPQHSDFQQVTEMPVSHPTPSSVSSILTLTFQRRIFVF